MIQNAYRGFSRANFTMLDNLALGYGGTKEEMERLLSDAEKLSGVKYDISSYSDMIEAIHVVQTEMGITGTTALEASTTIQGSVSAAKSAWANLVAGLGNENADLDQLVSNLVTSVETAAGNILPRITQILSGMGTAITQLAPVIAAEVPSLITSVLPSLVSGGAQLLTGLVTGIISALPGLVSAAPEIVSSIATAISDSLPPIMEAGTQLLSMLQNGIVSALPTLIPTAISAVFQFTEAATDSGTLGTVVDAALEIILALADGLISSLPELISKAPEIIGNLIDAIVENAPKLLTAAVEIIGALATGIIDNLPEIGSAAGKIIGKIVGGAMELIGDVWDLGKDIVAGVWSGISEKADWLKEKVTGFFTGIVDGVKSVLGIQSPSKVFRDEVGQYIALGVAEGIDDKADEAVKAADKMAKDVYSRSKDWADKNTKYLKLSYGEQVELWETIQSQFLQGSKQWADAEEEIFDLREKAADEYQKNLTSRTNEILNWYSLFDEVPEKTKKSGDDLLKNLQDQVDGISNFFGKVSALAERDGVGQALVEEIKEMGPKATDELDALLALSDEKLAEYASLFEQKANLAGQYAAMDIAGGFGTANVDFASSSVGQSSAAIINSISGGEAGAPVIPLTINLLTGDARAFAQWILPDLISVASANGTPIAGQQYA